MATQFPYDHFFEYYGEEITLPLPQNAPPSDPHPVIQGIHDFYYSDDGYTMGQPRVGAVILGL